MNLTIEVICGCLQKLVLPNDLICQRLLVVRVEARIVLQRAGLAEVHALEYRIGCGGLGQDEIDLGILAFEADVKLAVLIRVVKRAATYLHRSLQLGNLGGQLGFDGHRTAHQVGTDTEEVLVPHAQLRSPYRSSGRDGCRGSTGTTRATARSCSTLAGTCLNGLPTFSLRADGHRHSR